MTETRTRIDRLLSEKRCGLWPDCGCSKTLRHWEDRIFTETFTEAQLAWAETSIFLSLSCIEVHCPNKKMRAYATLQLLNSGWDRQRQIGNNVSRGS